METTQTKKRKSKKFFSLVVVVTMSIGCCFFFFEKDEANTTTLLTTTRFDATRYGRGVEEEEANARRTGGGGGGGGDFEVGNDDDDDDGRSSFSSTKNSFVYGNNANEDTTTTTTTTQRKAKQKQILKMMRGHAKMLQDKTPSRAYDAFEEDEGHDDYGGLGASSSSSCYNKNTHNNNDNQFSISDAFKNANSNGIGYSHMAMLSPLPKGSFYRWILVWQCSRGIEGTADMHLRAVFSDDLKKWTPKDGVELNVKKDKKNAVWAPVLHLDEKENVLWLYFSESVKCLRMMSPENRWSPGGNINAVSSIDGISWTKPKTLITSESESGNPKVIANKLVVHPKSKHWILPYWGEASSAKGCRSGHPTISGVLISKDSGHTWHSHGKVHPRHGRVIEGTVAVTENGDSILQLWRSKSGFLMQSTSANGGFTWTSPRKRTDLKNPDSKSSLIDFSYYVNDTTGKTEIISNSGISELLSRSSPSSSSSALSRVKQNLKHVIALAFNDASSGRKKLSLAISKSPGDGKRFSKLKEIEPGRSGVHFHYPTVIADPFYRCNSNKIRIIVAYSYMKRVNGWGNVYRQAKFGGIRVATVLMDASSSSS